ncbi:MAG: DUF6512 family protein [Candidatus Saccharibacteria bacterium]|uniref:Uncharacterized protein n=1 Tax=Candidatus Nanosyncoccus alces TaxID=2171997 RepID=A0ABY0FMA5_9BACT|nr:DUF6512 family protein [Candidatus Nanosyncoccus alces]MDO4399299.1 DUF6512 family protein [Candidatus Saccharibacteria bacterium]RYC74981.1 hypothetical protein G3RUM_00260 [Candidatus Nanosyncoccus alces]
MDNTLIMWLSIIAISATGTLAHFLYDLTGEQRPIGLFAAVNESVWEHIKIAITPSLLWALYDGYYYGENANYFCAKLVSLLVLVIFIPVAFYIYRKFTKKSILPLDITIFFAAIILSQATFYAIISLNPMWHIFTYLSCIGLFVFFGCYMTLTLAPLKAPIFKDPITGKYGFRAHRNFFKNLKKKHKK